MYVEILPQTHVIFLIRDLKCFFFLVECGGVLTRPIGNVTSPGYAVGNYTNNEQCLWLFRNQNQTSSSILIVFNNLRLENHARCLFDFLEIKEGIV